MACIKLPVWADIFEDFVGDYSHFFMFYFSPSGEKTALLNPVKMTYADCVNRRFTTISVSDLYSTVAPGGSAVDLGTVTVQKIKDPASDDQEEDQHRD